VVKYLENAGVPDFGIDALLDGAQDNHGRWPWGVMVDETSTADVVVVINYKDGIYRIESGPAEEYFGEDDEGGDEE
jgi:hypothetical protein